MSDTAGIPIKESFYHPELDVLRFFAFLTVFVHHVLPLDSAAYQRFGFPGPVAHWIASAFLLGGTGVDLFFTLSSFLISKLLLMEYRRFGRIRIVSFWTRRILRIWPLYFFFVCFAWFAVPHILPGDRLQASHVLAFLFFFANWSSAWFGFPNSVAAPLWSISVEEQFYLSWPMILSIFKPRNLVPLCMALLVISTGTRLILASRQAFHPAVWCNTFARLDPIALGALVALYTERKRLVLSTALRWILGFLGIGGPLAVMAWRGFAAYYDYSSVLFYPVVAAGSVLVLISVLRDAESGQKPKSWLHARLGSLGRISYGLYVYHVFIIHLTRRITARAGISDSRLLLMVDFAISLVLVVGVSYASYYLLERPFLRLKDRFAVIRTDPAAAGLK